ncbi:hypothetical protein BH11MYX4_BH11MYX4_63390 [soil metagenome]
MRPSPSLLLVPLAVALFAACEGPPAADPSRVAPLPAVGPNELRSPRVFAAIGDRGERSRALFLEATRVILHPRCKNCHPAGDSPAQGDLGLTHDPPVQRGPDDHGLPGLECTSCHQDENLELARVPGAEKWSLAPRVMAWVDRTPHAICEQVKDRARNGGKTLAEIVEHSAHDPLVAWGWAPGHGRAPAPGSQAQFAELMAAWTESGAECPREEARR